MSKLCVIVYSCERYSTIANLVFFSDLNGSTVNRLKENTNYLVAFLFGLVAKCKIFNCDALKISHNPVTFDNVYTSIQLYL